eukprot:12262063-Alexandrium_andersonii.AAC.1
MSASLVGSEMCIRDRRRGLCISRLPVCAIPPRKAGLEGLGTRAGDGDGGCLLYTSDAADDM